MNNRGCIRATTSLTVDDATFVNNDSVNSEGGAINAVAGTITNSTFVGNTANTVLGPLAGNGGPTRTLLPGGASAAVDAVPTVDCATSDDQRGAARPFESACDIGAVEADHRPDALIAKSGDITLTGNGFYNTTGASQGIVQKKKVNQKAASVGAKRNFLVTTTSADLLLHNDAVKATVQRK